MIILVWSCSINQRRSRRRGKAQHTSLSASTYKRLSFILLKCYLINVLVTLNISTAGGTFVIVELAGRVGHRWELLPHAGVDVWALGWTRWAHVIDHSEQRWDLMKVWQKSCIKVKSGGMQWNIHHHARSLPPPPTVSLKPQTVTQWISGTSWYAPDCKAAINGGIDNCSIMVISPLESTTITPRCCCLRTVTLSNQFIAAQSLCRHTESKFIAHIYLIHDWLMIACAPWTFALMICIMGVCWGGEQCMRVCAYVKLIAWIFFSFFLSGVINPLQTDDFPALSNQTGNSQRYKRSVACGFSVNPVTLLTCWERNPNEALENIFKNQGVSEVS